MFLSGTPPTAISAIVAYGYDGREVGGSFKTPGGSIINRFPPEESISLPPTLASSAIAALAAAAGSRGISSGLKIISTMLPA
jgi:hypothetical protein